MSSITSQYASLFSQFSGNKTDSPDGLSALLAPAKTASTPAMTSVSNDDLSYLLSLSEEARNYLTSQAATKQTSGDDSTGFALTADQQKQLDTIIAKYKDAPFTQDTFDALLHDLTGAGLAPDQMAAKDQVRQLNPTQSLLDALNGTSTNQPFSTENSANQKAKGDAYLKAIFSQWQSVSTTDNS